MATMNLQQCARQQCISVTSLRGGFVSGLGGGGARDIKSA